MLLPGIAGLLAVLGLPIVEAHVDAEDAVAGDRRDRAQHRCLESVLEHVHHVLQRREAQRYRRRIYDRVKPVVERRILPGGVLERKMLHALFRPRNDQEHVDKLVQRAVLVR